MKQEAIIITLSQETMKKNPGGYKAILEEWKQCSGNDKLWFYKTKYLPRNPDEVLRVYWVIKGRIRWKCKLLEVKECVMIKTAKNASPSIGDFLVLFDFEPIKREKQIEFTGFNGIKYSDIDI